VTGTALGIIAVLGLIAANGYFVAAEFSFVAARRSKFTELADQGDRRSVRAVQVHQRLSFMLSGAQLGITVTSLVVGFIAQPTIGAALEPVVGALGVPEAATFGISLTVAFILATITQMVFGELAPKNLAIAKPEPVARVLAPSTWWFMRVAGPFITFFDGSANKLLRALRIEPVQELHGRVSTQELDLIVDSSAETGHLSPQQAALLARAIDFSELEASDAMIPWNRTVTINSDASAADLRDLMVSAHSRFPVLDEEGAIRGIVHAKDLLGVSPVDYGTVTVGSLAHEVFVVPEAAGLRTVLRELREHATEMAVVVDEYGGPAGVVTLEDVVEELVGDIADEYDALDEDQPVEVGDGIWTVPAGWRVDEIERVTGFKLPDGDYDTVAGLVLERLERIPEVGDSVVVDGVQIDVMALDEWAITELQLVLVDDDTHLDTDDDLLDIDIDIDDTGTDTENEIGVDDRGHDGNGTGRTGRGDPDPDREDRR
jgi:CBS domain containing-hemolysin-like protein